MAHFDLPLDALRAYRPEPDEPADFDAFWKRTLASLGPPQPVLIPVANGLRTVTTFDVTFSGFGADPIRAWLHLPAGGAPPHPGVVEYLGYNSGRGEPHERMLWAAAGYAHMVMETRGQGVGPVGSDTADPATASGDAAVAGFLTRGVLDPERHYYRRVFADAVRAVDVLRGHPDVDPARVAVAGQSQGGGIALAVAGLVPDLLAALVDVPFLCHFRRSTTITDQGPYPEVVRYLQARRGREETVFRTLSYIDGVNHARRASAPALFSVGLMDVVCPPSSVFAAHHAYGGPAEIEVYPFNGHEGGAGTHQAKALRWLAARAGLR